MRARGLVPTFGIALAVGLVGCTRDRPSAERMEMPDSMPVLRALQNDSMRDEMLDTMPGGEMARGDSAAAIQLLKKKM